MLEWIIHPSFSSSRKLMLPSIVREHYHYRRWDKFELRGRSERDSIRGMMNSRDTSRRKDEFVEEQRSDAIEWGETRSRGKGWRDEGRWFFAEEENISVGAGRKDTDKNRVASSTRGNSNNFIIIERKHRVIHTGYVLMIYDHVSRSQPRTFSFSLFALENWRVQMDRDKPRHLEITVAYRRRLQIGIDSS